MELWQKWQISHNGNPAFAKVCCYPQHVVGIYNEALQRLSNIVGENFENEPEFPEELKEFVPPQECHRPLNLPYFPADWKNADRQNKIKNLLQNFKLPSPNNPNNYNPDDLQLWLLDYASKCLPENEETSTQIAYEAIKLLVHQMNQAHLLDLELKQRFECINFLDIIKIMAFSKANQVLSQLQNVPQQVIYRRQSLEDFKQQPWWLTYENVQVDYTLASHNESLQQCQQSSEAETIESIIQKAEKAARIAEQNLRALKKRPLDKSINHQTMELDESLYEFELAQKKGQFDLSTHVAKELLEEDCLGAVGGDLDVFNSSIAYASPPGRKRKRIDNQNEQHKENISNNSSSDMEKIMAKAFNLIEKVEMQELRQERLNKRMQKLNEFI